MLDFIKANRSQFMMSFILMSVVIFLITLAINAFLLENPEPINLYTLSLVIRIAMYGGLGSFLFVLLIGMINYYIAIRILSTPAFEKLIDQGFQKEYNSTNSKWVITTQDMVGRYKEFLFTVICNPNNSNDVKVFIHTKIPTEPILLDKLFESIDSQIKGNSIFIALEGLELYLPLKRRYFYDRFILQNNLDKLTNIAIENGLKPTEN